MLGGAGALAVAGAALAVGGCSAASSSTAGASGAAPDVVAFHGAHQAGILTPPQNRLVFASFRPLRDDRAALQTLLRKWSSAAALLSAGKPIGAVEPAEADAAPTDTGEALELPASHLTITVGLGRSVFVDAHGRDRLGLASSSRRRSSRSRRSAAARASIRLAAGATSRCNVAPTTPRSRSTRSTT